MLLIYLDFFLNLLLYLGNLFLIKFLVVFFDIIMNNIDYEHTVLIYIRVTRSVLFNLNPVLSYAVILPSIQTACYKHKMS